MNKKIILAVTIFIISFIIRSFLLVLSYDNLKHGSASYFGSQAIGLYRNKGSTTNIVEMGKIISENNLSGNYLNFEDNSERENLTIFLPGTGFVIYLLWKIFPVYNFSTLLFLQILIDSIIISLFSMMFYKMNKKLGVLIAVILLFNIVCIKRVLMVGYDFWPQITVLISFILIYNMLNTNKTYYYILLGLINAVAIWFREITILLLIVASTLILFINYKKGIKIKDNIKKTSVMILFFILSISLLSFYRSNISENARPTRNTLWHSVLVGIGQFSNPYDITANDISAWEFAKKNEKSLENKELWDMYNSPNSEYEIFAKSKSIDFIKNYPHLFIRNTIYRTAIILSPLLYSDGDFLPVKYQKIFFVLGLILLPVWFLGIYQIYKYNKILFYTIIILVVNTIISFSWWYVVGRVIIPILFTHFIVYLFALKYFYDKFFKDKLELYLKRNIRKQLVTNNSNNL
jgi:hypothetical protein